MTRRLRAELAFLIALALTFICAAHAPAEAETLALPGTFSAFGAAVQLREGPVPGGQAGVAERFLHVCRVTVQDAADRFTILHEVGHCLDDGVRDAALNAYACRVRLYACDPDEAAADLYALGHILTYGPDVQLLLGLDAERPVLSPAQARAAVSALLD